MADYFEVEAMVRVYHQYREIWGAEVGEQLEFRRENSDPHDIFAVAILKSGVVVGHVPKKLLFFVQWTFGLPFSFLKYRNKDIAISNPA